MNGFNHNQVIGICFFLEIFRGFGKVFGICFFLNTELLSTGGKKAFIFFFCVCVCVCVCVLILGCVFIFCSRFLRAISLQIWHGFRRKRINCDFIYKFYHLTWHQPAIFELPGPRLFHASSRSAWEAGPAACCLPSEKDGGAMVIIHGEWRYLSMFEHVI